MNKGKPIGDLGMAKNREIVIMRHEKEIMQAKLNIQNQKIRILELHEEIGKSNATIDILNKSIEEFEKHIQDEQNAAKPKPKPKPEGEKNE